MIPSVIIWMCSYVVGHPKMFSSMVRPSRLGKNIFGMTTWTQMTNRSYVACTRSLLVSQLRPLQYHTDCSSGQQDVSHRSLGEQTSNVSWWPKQSTWEACGLNVGYWSVDNETWFQKHLENIRNYHGTESTGNLPYHSAADWRNRLKFHKMTTKKVVRSAREAVEKWLSNHL